MIDLTGQRFGRWLVIELAGQSPGGNFLWLCRCDCGNEKPVLSGSLRSGVSKSCGCYSAELTTAKNKTHGLYGTPEYCSWAGMKYRCLTPTCKRYEDYGGRGITVCERWMRFENFLEDMGNKPSPEMGIERIDNDKGYYPENCKWGTEEEQQNNKRNSVFIEFKGIKKTLAQWAREVGIPCSALRARIIDYGWDIEKSLTTPSLKNAKS